MKKQLNKVRNMAGYSTGRNSAGRIGSSNLEKRAKKVKHGENGRFTGFGDVLRACDRWLRKNDAAYKRGREIFEKQEAQRLARREARNEAATNDRRHGKGGAA